MNQPKILYKYEGPIKRFGSTVCKKWTAYTEAFTKQQAINFFKYKAKIYMGLDKTAKIELVENNVKEQPRKQEVEDNYDDLPFIFE